MERTHENTAIESHALPRIASSSEPLLAASSLRLTAQTSPSPRASFYDATNEGRVRAFSCETDDGSISSLRDLLLGLPPLASDDLLRPDPAANDPDLHLGLDEIDPDVRGTPIHHAQAFPTGHGPFRTSPSFEERRTPSGSSAVFVAGQQDRRNLLYAPSLSYDSTERDRYSHLDRLSFTQRNDRVSFPHAKRMAPLPRDARVFPPFSGYLGSTNAMTPARDNLGDHDDTSATVVRDGDAGLRHPAATAAASLTARIVAAKRQTSDTMEAGLNAEKEVEHEKTRQLLDENLTPRNRQPKPQPCPSRARGEHHGVSFSRLWRLRRRRRRRRRRLAPALFR